MSTAKLYDSTIWPLVGGYDNHREVSHEHFMQLRKNIWLAENICAGNLDTLELYGKWNGDNTNWSYTEYTPVNWAGWKAASIYRFGSITVKYRWGVFLNQVDLFVFFHSDTRGDTLDLQPPVIGGQLNSDYWLLAVDPNKYSHWNKGAGRPDIGANARYKINYHGFFTPPQGVGHGYGYWEAWKELPCHKDPFEQIPHIKNPGDEARHFPVEQRRDWITKEIRPVMDRSYKDGTVGTNPVTFWHHSLERNKVSEYVYVDGDPAGSYQVGPDRSDPKFNQALQDRVIHCVENNYKYSKAVDAEWKETWQHWNTYGIEISVNNILGCVNKHPNYAGQYKGSFTWPFSYVLGDVVYYAYYWWRCIRPVTTSDDYWRPGGPYSDDTWTRPLHQPNYIPTDPIYVQFSDYLFNCNSSGYEKALKEMGDYDWWWCDRSDGEFPEVPWWLYQRHNYLMTQHDAVPDGGFNVEAQQKYPKPRGCWRKVWRYSMCWDHHRDLGQKARLGKIIDIDGEKVSMMWPGELGPPPGYDDIEGTVGEVGGYFYNYRQKALVITQAQYDNMDTWSFETWTYRQYYKVVDIEDAFIVAYRANKTSIENRLKERHDPLDTEWLDDNGTMKEYPIFEKDMIPDLLNDLKAVLEQLNLVGQQTTVTEQRYRAHSNLMGFPTMLTAYQAGKAQCDSKEILHASSGIYGDVGYVGFVSWNNTEQLYDTQGTVTHDYNCELAWTEVTITRDVDVCFPATSVGTLIFDILAKAYPIGTIDAPCAIGAGNFVYTPPPDSVWHRAYIGQVNLSYQRVYDGVGSDPTDWDLVGTFEIVPGEPWPDEGLFTMVGQGRDEYVQTAVDINTGADIAMAWEINFDGFDESVFEQDPNNIIKVS